MKEPDPQTIAAARGGDDRAFDDLVRRYQAEVWRFAVYLVHDTTLAEEVAQEAFLRVFRFLPRFRGDSTFSTWLFAITRNCARDAMRAAGRETRLRSRMKEMLMQQVAEPPMGYEIKEAIAALPPDLREPLVLVDVFETTYAETATLLRIPQGTVKSRVFRARQSLMVQLHATEEEAGHEG